MMQQYVGTPQIQPVQPQQYQAQWFWAAVNGIIALIVVGRMIAAMIEELRAATRR